MRINIILNQQFAETIGAKKLTLEFSGKKKISFREFVKEFTKLYPSANKILSEEGGEPSYMLLVLLNDKPLRYDEEKKVSLRDGDTLRFYMIASGG